MKLRLDPKMVLRLVPAGVGVAAAVGVLLFRLHTLVPGLSPGEVQALAGSSSLRTIIHNPLNAPYKLAVYTLLKLHLGVTSALRGAAAVYGLLTLACFFFILRRWQTTRIAVLGTILFGAASTFTQTARLGTPNVLLFGLVILVAAGLWLRSGQKRLPSLAVGVSIVVLALYVPGLIWFVLAGVIWRRRVILEELKYLRWWTVGIGIAVILGLAAPLIVTGYKHPHILLTAAGLPQQLPRLHQLVTNLANLPLQVFIRSPLAPGQWVGRTSILDVFATTMFALGVYAEIRYHQLDRAHLLLGVLVLGTMLITLGGPVAITLLVPFVYLIVAAGVTYLLHEWFKVFPLNPIARSIGVIVLILAIASSCAYQLDRSFIAWPHNPETRAVFSWKP